MASSARSSSRCRKLALIIGNSNYSGMKNQLSHSVTNAEQLRIILKKINFNVTIYTDVRTASEMMENVKNFAEKIEEGDLVLFYFSGHGNQVEDKNYLIPVDDAKIETDKDVKDLASNFERILERLVERNPSYVTVFILDCCRPYFRKGESVSSGK